jgi:hypothetical protein
MSHLRFAPVFLALGLLLAPTTAPSALGSSQPTRADLLLEVDEVEAALQYLDPGELRNPSTSLAGPDEVLAAMYDFLDRYENHGRDLESIFRRVEDFHLRGGTFRGKVVGDLMRARARRGVAIGNGAAAVVVLAEGEVLRDMIRTRKPVDSIPFGWHGQLTAVCSMRMNEHKNRVEALGALERSLHRFPGAAP